MYHVFHHQHQILGVNLFYQTLFVKQVFYYEQNLPNYLNIMFQKHEGSTFLEQQNICRLTAPYLKNLQLKICNNWQKGFLDSSEKESKLSTTDSKQKLNVNTKEVKRDFPIIKSANKSSVGKKVSSFLMKKLKK